MPLETCKMALDGRKYYRVSISNSDQSWTYTTRVTAEGIARSLRVHHYKGIKITTLIAIKEEEYNG